MRFLWRSGRGQESGARSQEPESPAAAAYESVRIVDSKVIPGVRFTVVRMSFERRVELMRRIRELAKRAEFLAAGQSAEDKMDAALVQAEIERVYVAWGLRAVSGLVVDGRDASPENLLGDGPEELFREALAAVRAETGLNEEARKNC
jgi:hypothetical protein